MQRQIEIEVTPRDSFGKNEARRLRVSGKVPAIVYGLGKESIAVAVDTKVLTTVLKDPSGHNRVLNLTLNGSKEPTLAVDYQIDPVKRTLLHVDLQRLDLKKHVTVEVPIKSLGVAYGVKTEGGFEEMVNREVLVECLPLDIPESIDIDVTELILGGSVRVRDLPSSDKYSVADDEDKLLLHVLASRAALLDEDTTEVEEAESPEEKAESEQSGSES